MTHILIVTADFYPAITAMLVSGATAALKGKSATYDIVNVPGAFEIPGVIAMAVASPPLIPPASGGDKGGYDGFIALGCVIRGETTHYDYVCGESARGLMELSLKHAAIGYGILTVETMQQAEERADIAQGNKGEDAALACLRMIELKRQFDVNS